MSEAVLAQLYAIRAQVEAAILLVQSGGPPSLPMLTPIDPADTCPNCGASGETQLNISTIDGTRRRKCSRCQVEREL